MCAQRRGRPNLLPESAEFGHQPVPLAPIFIEIPAFCGRFRRPCLWDSRFSDPLVDPNFARVGPPDVPKLGPSNRATGCARKSSTPRWPWEHRAAAATSSGWRGSSDQPVSHSWGQRAPNTLGARVERGWGGEGKNTDQLGCQHRPLDRRTSAPRAGHVSKLALVWRPETDPAIASRGQLRRSLATSPVRLTSTSGQGRLGHDMVDRAQSCRGVGVGGDPLVGSAFCVQGRALCLAR